MGQFPNKPTQFKPGWKGGPGRPKGSVDLSTHIREMLDDPDFTTKIVNSKGKQIEFKGKPAKAIVRTAILKAMGGNTQWAEWLAKHGYGTKQIHEIENTPIKEILEKYGLNKEERVYTESEQKEKKEIDAGQAQDIEKRPSD